MKLVLSDDASAGPGSPVDLPALLDDLVSMTRRYIIIGEHRRTAIALWVVFAYSIDAFQVAPILAFWSPVKRCGKTRALQLLVRLVPKPKLTSNVTPAALFRTVDEDHPTLLIDELDSFAGLRPEVRNLLNSGHAREAAFVERVGPKQQVRRFSTWCPKVLALIGTLPGTVFDRSIRIEMRRKPRSEKVEDLRYADKAAFEIISALCDRFAKQNLEQLRVARPSIPKRLACIP